MHICNCQGKPMNKENNMLCMQRAAAFALALLACGCATNQSLPPSVLSDTAAQQAAGSTVQVSQLPGTAGQDDPYAALQPDPDPFAGRYRDGNRTPSGSAPTATRPATRLAPSPFPGAVSQASSEYGITRSNSTYPAGVGAAQNQTRSAVDNSQDSRKDAASSIVLGEGDVILFNMFGQEDMETTAFVSSQGSVSLPLIGDTEVGGLTPGQAEQRIADAYRSGGYFNNPQVNITLEKYRSQQISVLGEVNLPGRYPLETRTTVLDALAQAEGVKATGSHLVTVIRKNQDGTTERKHVNLNELVTQSGGLDSYTLSAGDIVYVPEAQLFYIYGEVRRPDGYAIKPGMTVMQALSLGGGLTDKGSNSRIEIQRKDGDGSRTIKPDLTEVVRPDDVIYVKERFF